MHVITRPSSQFRLKVRNALLRSLHHSFIYRRLIVAGKAKGARTKTVGRALHKKLIHSPWEVTSLLKFIYGQLYNGKLTMRYGHAPTNECPLCHMPDSCTHIAGKCPDHEALRISRHNTACQLIHTAILKTSKGGGTLHSAPDLVLVTADTGTHAMTTGDSIDSISPTSEDYNLPPTTEPPPHDWFSPPPTSEDVRCKRHTDVFQDFR